MKFIKNVENGIDEFRIENEWCKLDIEMSKETIWILNINTKRSMRGRGYAKEVLNLLFEMAKHTRRVVVPGVYTDDGRKYLKPLLKRLAKKHKVKMIDEYE